MTYFRLELSPFHVGDFALSPSMRGCSVFLLLEFFCAVINRASHSSRELKEHRLFVNFDTYRSLFELKTSRRSGSRPVGGQNGPNKRRQIDKTKNKKRRKHVFMRPNTLPYSLLSSVIYRVSRHAFPQHQKERPAITVDVCMGKRRTLLISMAERGLPEVQR